MPALATVVLPAVLLVLQLLVAPALVLGQGPSSWNCRFAPGSTHSHCGLPFSLGNFQGYYGCNETVRMGRPKSLEELQAIVEEYPRVKAVGVGHSWWAAQFCAGDDADAVNLVTTELKPTLDLILSPVDPAVWRNQTMPEDFPIKVDEATQTVTVAAGVPQRILLDYLAEYRHWSEPAGWTLPAFTWFVDQTIGGAVATGSHGSSMKYGSLSSQVVGFKLVTANGTLAEVTPASHHHLFRALGVSVGRLGVITELTMRIVPQKPVQKNVQVLNFTQFAEQALGVQQAYAAAKQAGDVKGMKEALFRVDETQAFWYLPTNRVYRVDYQHLDHEPEGVRINIDSAAAFEPAVQGRRGLEGPGEGEAVFEQVPRAPQSPQPRLVARNATYWSEYYQVAGREYVTPGTFQSRKAYLSMTEAGVRMTSNFAPYDQFEVSVPLELAGTCLLEVGREVYGTGALWNGFRTPALLRFVSGEDFYLSNSAGGPRMYVNLEDYLSHQTGKPNTDFLRVVALFRERCQARLHWGKNGFPQFARCFDGASEYPETWCQFGCAVQELDPEGKFASAAGSDVWTWNATRAGQPVPLASCCTSAGFSAQCQCARRGDCRPE